MTLPIHTKENPMRIKHILSVLTLCFLATPIVHAACKTGDIRITSLPFTASIDNKTYCLPSNLVYDAKAKKTNNPIQLYSRPAYAAITVEARNVVINLNASAMIATNLLPDAKAIGIYSTPNVESVVIQNGIINGFDVGVVANAVKQSTVKSIRVMNSKSYGIVANADAVDISYNHISKTRGRWIESTAAIFVDRSINTNINYNIISDLRAKNMRPESQPFYGAHGITVTTYQRVNIDHNTLYDLATESGEFSFVSLFNFYPSPNGTAYIYSNSVTYPISYSASQRKNLGVNVIGKHNLVSVYDNEFTGFLHSIFWLSNSENTTMTYFNNRFHRYLVDGQYDPLVQQYSATPTEVGGNQQINHETY